MTRPKTDRDRRTLRTPRPLTVQLEQAAKHSGRSWNAEAVHRLMRSFDGYSSDLTLQQFKGHGL